MSMYFRPPPSQVACYVTFAATALVTVGCATITTGSHSNESADFADYDAFSWISDVPFVRGAVISDIPISVLTQRKIENAVRSELEDKGYEFASDRAQADFLIAYTVGTREDLVHDKYSNYYDGDWAWHVNGQRYYGQNVSYHTYTTGTLGVDVFDAQSGDPVWHGWAEKTITPDDRQDPSLTITTGVNRLLADFPK